MRLEHLKGYFAIYRLKISFLRESIISRVSGFPRDTATRVNIVATVNTKGRETTNVADIKIQRKRNASRLGRYRIKPETRGIRPPHSRATRFLLTGNNIFISSIQERIILYPQWVISIVNCLILSTKFENIGIINSWKMNCIKKDIIKLKLS